LSQTEKLRKAVELAISSGHQLSKEAFDYLQIIAATEDPTECMKKAITRMETYKEQPIFIERRLLEQLASSPELPNQTTAEEAPEPVIPAEKLPQPAGDEAPWNPYARDADADIKIIENPGLEISSEGTIDDYLEYFQDRFKKIERILRQRIDVKSAATITDALRAAPNTHLKIISMITDKRESKQRVILTLEDLKTCATALVPQNATLELQKKARSILLDQVICISVVKTRSKLLVVDDIVLPDVPQRTQHRAAIPVYAVLTSDLHIGSAKFTKEAFTRFILWLNGKYGDNKMREIAGHVKYIVVAGDIVDGIGIYPNQAKELAVRDVNRQYRLAARYLSQIPRYIEVLLAPGNHDPPRKALPQPPIAETFLGSLLDSGRFRSLGNPCLISLHGVEILIFHGRSLDDVTSTIPGMSQQHPEKAMRLLLQGRHLAPLYGGKTPISPETRDSLVITRVPDILHAGHIHALEHGNYRGVLIVNSGCWQEQTDYMKRNGFNPTPAQVPVVNLQTLELTILSFN
jgi:DNA polymerase II small subunit